MTARPFSRRDLLFGAGAATIAGPAGCARDSSFLSRAPSSSGGVSALLRLAPGVKIMGGNSLRVITSQLIGNSGAAVAVSDATNVAIAQNTIFDDGNAGQVASVTINGHTDKIHVGANHISRGKRGSYPGIAAGDSARIDTGGQILDNTVHGFGTGVVLGSNSESFVVQNNDLRLNTTCYTNKGQHNTINGNLC